MKTVKVVHKESESGFMIINDEDFDKEKHELFVVPEKKEEVEEPEEPKAFEEKSLLNMKRSEIDEVATFFGIEVDKEKDTVKTLTQKILEAQAAKTE